MAAGYSPGLFSPRLMPWSPKGNSFITIHIITIVISFNIPSRFNYYLVAFNTIWGVTQKSDHPSIFSSYSPKWLLVLPGAATQRQTTTQQCQRKGCEQSRFHPTMS